MYIRVYQKSSVYCDLRKIRPLTFNEQQHLSYNVTFQVDNCFQTRNALIYDSIYYVSRILNLLMRNGNRIVASKLDCGVTSQSGRPWAYGDALFKQLTVCVK